MGKLKSFSFFEQYFNVLMLVRLLADVNVVISIITKIKFSNK